jgi:alanine racemase
LSPTVVEIHLPSLRHNLQEVTRRVGTAAVLAVVKANAYGHGAVPVSLALLAAGAHQLGVATVEEGLELRDAGVTAPILVMGGVHDIQTLQRSTLTPVLPSRGAVEAAGRLADPRTAPLRVHLKIDTGMSRLGLAPDEALALLRSDWPPNLHLEGVMSHLASADEPDGRETEQQLARFRAFLDAIRSAGLPVPTAHIANSAAILKYPSSHLDLVRPGLMLYGYASGPTPSTDLRPVLTWKSRVIQIKKVEKGQPVSYGGTFVASRPSTLAVLPVGYADGYSRALSNKGHALIGGRPAPVVGRVCMDLTVVDVTDHPAVRPGDEAVLLGQQGTAAITANDLAAWQDTISYEVLCRIGPRVTRVYLEN